MRLYVRVSSRYFFTMFSESTGFFAMVLTVVSNVALGTNGAALGLSLTTFAPILLLTEKVLGVMPVTSGWAIVPATKGVRLELSPATVTEELALCVIV